MNPFRNSFLFLANLLARLDIIDRHRGHRIADLSWPPILGKAAREFRLTADLAIIGLIIGPEAIAGIGFATIYWKIAGGISFGLSGGTINQVSQRFGAEERKQLDLAIKQSIWVGAFIALPFMVVYWSFAEQLIALFKVNQRTVTYGAIYLQVLSLGTVLRALTAIASRSLAGADDTWTPMVIRSIAAILNILLNVIFVIGLGFGVFGVALGTLLAEIFTVGVFAWGFFLGRLPIIGDLPIRIKLSSPYIDIKLTKQLIFLSTPLMFRALIKRGARFPLFMILAMFGPTIVAAYEIGKRIRGQMKAPGPGFSLSASSLVGQSLGAGNEVEAEAFSQDILRFSLVVYAVISIIVFIFARPLAQIFVNDTNTAVHAVPFIRAVAAGLLGYGANRSLTGVLKGAGDNNWPMFAELIGLYVVMLPLAYFGALTQLGLIALYLATVSETIVPAVANFYRVRTGKWKQISRSYRPTTTD